MLEQKVLGGQLQAPGGPSLPPPHFEGDRREVRGNLREIVPGAGEADVGVLGVGASDARELGRRQKLRTGKTEDRIVIWSCSRCIRVGKNLEAPF